MSDPFAPACDASLVMSLSGLAGLRRSPPDFADFPIVLVEPHAPAPVGDRWPCHWFSPEVEWPAAVGPVLRSDRPDSRALRAADARARAAANEATFGLRRRVHPANFVVGFVFTLLAVGGLFFGGYLLAQLPEFLNRVMLP